MMKAKNYIQGSWADGSLGILEMLNPSYGTKIGEIARGGEKDVDRAVKAARLAFEGEWGEKSATERGEYLYKISRELQKHKAELAKLESEDTGKPMKQALTDAGLIARYFEYYAGAADKLFGETIPFMNGYTVYTQRVPLGVTGHIIPWNYPLQMTGRTLAPALAAGNATVLKPAEDACLSIVRVFEIIHDVGLPAGTLNLVTGLGSEAGKALARHPGIDHLAFTGSTETGTEVMKNSADHIRPVLLELGGKSPQILFQDADLEAAYPAIVNAIIQNAGQTCSAGSRLLVQEEIFQTVVAELTKRFKKLIVGPADSDPDIGPIINKKQLIRIQTFVDEALERGAKILAQPDCPDGTGYFFPPTLMGNLDQNNPMAQNEVFGPVLAVIPFRNESEAIELANGVEYGLIAAVWTRDVGRAHRVVESLDVGQVYINGYGAGGGVELPFGGVKKSGFGREKGFEALYDVTSVKTVIVNHV